jgi:Uncharacterized low-complexity proteins
VTRNESAIEIPDDQCGYTYSEDPDRIHSDSRANSCVRDPLPDTDRCKVHAEPSDTEHKVDSLKNNPPDGDSLDGAILPHEFATPVKFSRISLLRGADLRGADLSKSSLLRADLRGADLSEASLSDADLRGADLRKAGLNGADLSKASLRQADLSGAALPVADLSEAPLDEADLSEAHLPEADLSEAIMNETDLSGATLRRANLSEADLWGADLSETELFDADLSNADLCWTDLRGANLEQATIIGTNLFDADLTRVTPYGARIEAVQINDGTEFHADSSEYARWWQREGTFLAAPPRCGYDPKVEQPDDAADTDQEELLAKAADTYRQFEELALQNTQPALQSSMFVLRQDMQRKRYWTRGQYGQWFANRVFRSVSNTARASLGFC